MGKAREIHVEWKNRGKVLRGSAHVAGRNTPWVIFSHGFTGHRFGPGYLFVRMSRELAKAGFSSLRFDFSGSGESDGAFHELTVASMKSDLLSAVKQVRKCFLPKKIILTGHSLGGMIAALCSTTAKPDGIALLSPVGNPWGLIERRKPILETGPNKKGFYEYGPYEMALPFLDGLRSLDPITEFVSVFRGPLLLVQGDSDASISIAESKKYVDAARKIKIDSTYLVLKKSDHNYSTVPHYTAVIDTVTSWAKERFL